MRRRDFVRTVVAAGALPLVGCDPGADGDGTRAAGAPLQPRRSARLDGGWRFVRDDPARAASPGLDDASWDRVTLPHTARIEALVTGEPGSETYQWQGVCWYRRRLRIGPEAAGRKVLLRFEAAMNVAEVWLDGQPVGGHRGGFLPFVLDITDRVTPGRDALLAVRLGNRDDPVTGPKPLDILDFNLYHGLYRYVHLIVTDRLRVTDPLLADRPAGGGVFVTYPEVDDASAVVRVRTHVANEHDGPRSFRVRTTLLGPDGVAVGEALSDAVELGPGSNAEVDQRVDVQRPRLWSPRAPHLHTVASEVVTSGGVVDALETRVGIRRIEIGREGFRINGERMFLRGTNRHQEHPYVGYAVPAAAHHRDARRIKEAGFDYVRLSHYPHAPAFMDACDELGLVVMDCIPGWQYFGEDPAFDELQYRNCRDLVRRDRNHPSVILWEVSLNETVMPPDFVERTHAIAHEEYPGDQCFTCGWVEGHDVFIRARQHGGCEGVDDAPCVVSEYGDWEYYAMTAGLEQHAWDSLAPDASNSRQLRWHGEEAMLQQATNFQEAHDDNLGGGAFADGLWVMFDYNRGYAPDIESSGCSDLFRLPKYSRHFFRSQRPPGEALPGLDSGPMVFLATEWASSSPPGVRVFSNCSEVELRLDGRPVGRRGPDAGRMSSRLAHPPFTFEGVGFTPGALEAVGYLDGREAVRDVVRTAGPIEALGLRIDRAGLGPATEGRDVLFCHGELQDRHGTVVPDAWENVSFGVTGDASLVGRNPFSTDAGIASILVSTDPGATSVAVFALSIVRAAEGARILGASAGLLGPAPGYEIRYTTDGSAPGPGSPVRGDDPIEASPVRAALIAGERVVADLDERTEKFRIPGSSAPGSRQPFDHRDPQTG